MSIPIQQPNQQIFETWHKGEKYLQALAGSKERLSGRVFDDRIADSITSLIEQASLLFLADVDDAGSSWVSIASGPQGFLSTPNPHVLHASYPLLASDPLVRVLKPGNNVGGLTIHFATRRRYRINGKIKSADSHGFTIDVEQAYFNCPKYIIPRELHPLTIEPDGPEVIEFSGLPPDARDLIKRADTFFIASNAGSIACDGRSTCDLSHRGGYPGFVKIGEDGTLSVNEFHGNQFYNTLGNILLNPFASVSFICPDTQRALVLSGQTKLEGTPRFNNGEPNTGLRWKFKTDRGYWLINGLRTHYGAPSSDGLTTINATELKYQSHER